MCSLSKCRLPTTTNVNPTTMYQTLCKHRNFTFQSAMKSPRRKVESEKEGPNVLGREKSPTRRSVQLLYMVLRRWRPLAVARAFNRIRPPVVSSRRPGAAHFIFNPAGSGGLKNISPGIDHSEWRRQSCGLTRGHMFLFFFKFVLFLSRPVVILLDGKMSVRSS